MKIKIVNSPVLYIVTATILISINAQTLTAGVLPLFHLTDLGALGGTNSVAEGISPGGLVTGYAIAADGVSHLFLYDGQMHDLGAFNGNDTYGDAVNDNRQIAGYYRVTGLTNYYPYHAMFYDGTNMHDLGTMGGIASMATGINSAGVVAGWSYITNGSTQCDGFLYYSNAFHRLKGWYDIACTVDDSNRAVGYNYTYTNSSYKPIAYIYNGSFRYLGTLGGDYSMSVAINPAGQAVGESDLTNGNTHAFLYDGSMRDLGTLGGTYSSASWLNARGDVCGVSSLTNGDDHGFFYTGGKMYDLNTLLDSTSAGWIVSGAWSMNDAGQIVGSGTDPVTGESHAILLTPCPTIVQTSHIENNFAFSFQSISNRSYTVEYNDVLGTPHWQFLKTINGDGSLMQLIVPMTNTPQRFFRIKQP